MKGKWLCSGMVATLALMLSAAMWPANAEEQVSGPGWTQPGAQMQQLTEEQRAQIDAKRKELQEQGASREEIRSAVRAMLQEWGIKVPERGHGRGGWFGGRRAWFGGRGPWFGGAPGQFGGPGPWFGGARGRFGGPGGWFGGRGARFGGPGFWFGGPRGGFGCQLTEEQRAQVDAKRKELQAQGVSREEMRSAVRAMLQEWGIKVPERGQGRDGWFGGPGGRFGGPGAWFGGPRTRFGGPGPWFGGHGARFGGPGPWFGSTPGQFGGPGARFGGPGPWFGTTPGQFGGRGAWFGGPRGGFGCQLTEEQRAQVDAKRKELREQGASREEVRAAVRAMLEQWGMELPQRGGDHLPADK